MMFSTQKPVPVLGALDWCWSALSRSRSASETTFGAMDNLRVPGTGQDNTIPTLD